MILWLTKDSNNEYEVWLVEPRFHPVLNEGQEGHNMFYYVDPDNSQNTRRLIVARAFHGFESLFPILKIDGFFGIKKIEIIEKENGYEIKEIK